MISTTCPGCSAKFQVPEDLVTGKTVRFRCRKCGGAIEVDGTKKEAATGVAAPANAPAPDAPGRKRTATLVYGADSPGPAKAPAPPIEGTPLPPKVEPVAAKPAMFDLALTPPPPNTDDLWDLPPEALTVQPQKAAVAEVETKPARVGALKKDTPKPDAPQPSTPKPAAAKAETAPKFEAPRPPISADNANAQGSKPESPAPSKPSSSIPKRPSKEPVASSPASVRRAFGLDSAAKDKPAPTSDKSPPASDKAAPSSDKKPAAASDELPASDAGAKAPKAKPLFADRKSDATMGRRTRGAMDLGGVFASKDKEKKPAGDEGDLDVEVDLEDKLDLKPLVIGGANRPQPPPAPQLKKVVLDMSEVGSSGTPESKSLPSVAFFSPVLVQQAALAAPVPPAELTEEEKHEAKQQTSKALIWAAVIAGVGVLAAGGILLWTQLGGSESAPATRTGSGAETATAAPTPPPQVGVRTPEPAASAAPAATAEAPPAASTATAAAAETAAKPGTEPPAKAATDTKEPAAGTKKPESTAEAKAAAASTTPEPAKPEPPKVEAKQPQPAEASNDIPFDKAAAGAALNSRKGAAAGCKQEGGPTGHAKVSVTFAPSGRVTTANIMGPPFAGTPVGGCIASKFRGATVPPFSGPPVTVSTSVAIF